MTSPARSAGLTILPFLVMLALSWVWQPRAAYGRTAATVVLGGLVVVLAALSWPRRRRLALRANSELRWDAGLEAEDPYRVSVSDANGVQPLLEHYDAAVVLSDLQRLIAVTGARLSCPPDLEPLLALPTAERRPLAFRVSTRVVGPRWVEQRRVATATLGGAGFVLLVFLLSARAEAGLSALSIALPIASIAFVALVGAALALVRVEASLGPDGLRVENALLGFKWQKLALEPGSILGVYALGHPGFPERDLVVETTSGIHSVPLAGDSARRIAAHARTSQPGLDGRPRARSADDFDAPRGPLPHLESRSSRR